MRALIVTQDASIIIGKGGRHVKEIRVRGLKHYGPCGTLIILLGFCETLQEQSSARVNVSESIVGNPERILSVQGALDAVSKVSLTPSGLSSLT